MMGLSVATSLNGCVPPAHRGSKPLKPVARNHKSGGCYCTQVLAWFVFVLVLLYDKICICVFNMVVSNLETFGEQATKKSQ